MYIFFKYLIGNIQHISVLNLHKSMIHVSPHWARAAVPNTQLCVTVCKCSLELLVSGNTETLNYVGNGGTCDDSNNAFWKQPRLEQVLWTNT